MGIFKDWSNRRKEREERGERLWRLIGYVNLSRSSPREMVGTHNLASVPDWMWRNITTTVDPEREIILKFPEDTEYEYKFKPRYPELVRASFYVDIFKRQQRWKKFV